MSGTLRKTKEEEETEKENGLGTEIDTHKGPY